MQRTRIRRFAIGLAAWLPFFVLWFLFSLSLANGPVSAIVISSLIMMGSAGLLGLAVWSLCERVQWPLGFRLRFYLAQLVFAVVYAAVWTLAVYLLDSIRRAAPIPGFWAPAFLVRQLLLGIWLYAICAGISYAVQTRSRLHEKEMLAARAEALVAAARLDAIRARLNPHFLFNALHTLDALVKFRPTLAEGAIERLGDMLRYTLKEDGRDLVDFSEEYDFARQYLAFEQLRYEDRLKIDVQIDPASFDFAVPPFSIQTLAENAVHHAISVRPEGGSIWIKSFCRDRTLTVSVRDDGPGTGAEERESHQFGLRSLRERLRSAFGPSADLSLHSGADGFSASFQAPLAEPRSETKGASVSA